MHVIHESSVDVGGTAIPVLLLPIPGRTTTSIRIIAEAGSTSERASEWGIAHFLEHMAFKGTDSKSCEEIVQALAGIGQANAYTSHDRTVYYINTVAKFAETATHLLMEMFFESNFPEAELEKERGVILQEWQMQQDDPSSYFVHCYHHVWPAAGHAIIGTDSHIKQHSREAIKAFKHRTYTQDRIFIAVVGHIPDSARMLDFIRDAAAVRGKSPALPTDTPASPKLRDVGSCYTVKHASMQAWLSVWYPWYSLAEAKDLHFTPYVFDNILGDGLHSLLPVELREKRGLCYSTGCGSTAIGGIKSFFLYAMLGAEKIDEALQVMHDVLVNIRDQGIDPHLQKVSEANFLVKSLHELDDISFISRQLDGWLANRAVRGNTIFNVEDATAACERFTDAGAREMAAKLLSSQSHIITMTHQE